MKFDFLTIFPDMVLAYLQQGVLGRAVKKGLVDVRVVDIRDFATGSHKNTDDRPYGGGAGMVMKPGPIYRAILSVQRAEGKSQVILLSPQGEKFDQPMAWELSKYDQIIFVCGRYEGVDERVRSLCIEREISIGDYILSGGELGSLVLMDAIARLVPGVLGSDTSNLEDSFENGLLEYPQYTRPEIFEGKEVPAVLLSGDHERIRQWRRAESLKRTFERRPDLLKRAQLSSEDEAILTDLCGNGNFDAKS